MPLTLTILAALVASAPSPLAALRDVPDLAGFVDARPIIVDGWLAFAQGDAVARLAPVPVIPAPPAKPACATLPTPEPDWAGYWRFPTPDPVVLHLAEEATLWAWAKRARCWVAVPLALRGEPAGAGTIAIAARAEPAERLGLDTLDPALAGLVLADEGGRVRLLRGVMTVVEAPVDDAAHLLNDSTDGETWTRTRDPDVEAAPSVKRTLSASLERFPDGARVLELRREARWKTDGAAQGGSVTGKRLTLWRLDVTDPASPRVLVARNGSFGERQGDGAHDALYLVARRSVERVPGGELAVDVTHEEAIDAWTEAGSDNSRWVHSARVVLRAGDVAIELFPRAVAADAAPAVAGPTASVAVDGRTVAVKAGKTLHIVDGKPRELAIFRPGADLPAGRPKASVGLALEPHRLVVHAWSALTGPVLAPIGAATQTGQAELVALLPRAAAGPPLVLSRVQTVRAVEQ